MVLPNKLFHSYSRNATSQVAHRIPKLRRRIRAFQQVHQVAARVYSPIDSTDRFTAIHSRVTTVDRPRNAALASRFALATRSEIGSGGS